MTYDKLICMDVKVQHMGNKNAAIQTGAFIIDHSIDRSFQQAYYVDMSGN